MNKRLIKMYNSMNKHYGHLDWWPGDTKFEIIVGAILTQNTAWSNVEKAIRNLKKAKVLTPHKLYALKTKTLAQLIQPSGFFNIKAKRLRNFMEFFKARYDLNIKRMFKTPLLELRRELLHVKGIGKETADSILLYAGNKPTFVIDAYTKRILSRHDIINNAATYEDMKEIFEINLPRDAKLYNDFHAQIVNIGKDFCRTKARCEKCPLQKWEEIRV